MAKKEKVELDDLEEFNRISTTTTALFTLVFMIISLSFIIPIILVVSISFTAESSIQ